MEDMDRISTASRKMSCSAVRALEIPSDCGLMSPEKSGVESRAARHITAEGTMSVK